LKNERSDKQTRKGLSDLEGEGELAARTAGRRRTTGRRSNGRLRREGDRQADGGNNEAIRAGLERARRSPSLDCFDRTEFAEATNSASDRVLGQPQRHRE
jgi:hypothetical protein